MRQCFNVDVLLGPLWIDVCSRSLETFHAVFGKIGANWGGLVTFTVFLESWRSTCSGLLDCKCGLAHFMPCDARATDEAGNLEALQSITGVDFSVLVSRRPKQTPGMKA